MKERHLTLSHWALARFPRRRFWHYRHYRAKNPAAQRPRVVAGLLVGVVYLRARAPYAAYLGITLELCFLIKPWYYSRSYACIIVASLGSSEHQAALFQRHSAKRYTPKKPKLHH